MERNQANAESILHFVKKLRTAQKTFFTSRDPEVKNQALKDSKQMERDLDKRIDEYFSPQKSLF